MRVLFTGSAGPGPALTLTCPQCRWYLTCVMLLLDPQHSLGPGPQGRSSAYLSSARPRARSALCRRAGLGLSMNPGGQEAAVLCMIDVWGKSEPCLAGKEGRCRLCWGSSSGSCSQGGMWAFARTAGGG